MTKRKKKENKERLLLAPKLSLLLYTTLNSSLQTSFYLTEKNHHLKNLNFHKNTNTRTYSKVNK